MDDEKNNINAEFLKKRDTGLDINGSAARDFGISEPQLSGKEAVKDAFASENSEKSILSEEELAKLLSSADTYDDEDFDANSSIQANIDLAEGLDSELMNSPIKKVVKENSFNNPNKYEDADSDRNIGLLSPEELDMLLMKAADGAEFDEKFNFDESGLDFDFDTPGSSTNKAEMLDINDEDLEFIKDFSVFDTVEREDLFSDAVLKATEMADDDSEGRDFTIENVGDLKKDEDRDESKIKTTGPASLKDNSMFVIMGVLLFLIVGTGILGLVLINDLNVRYVPKNPIILEGKVIKQPNYVANSLNHVYLSSKAVILDDESVALTKFLANKEATVFYFDKKIDWGKFDVSLTDDKDNSYDVAIDGLADDYYSNELCFEPLNSGVKGVILTVADIVTGEVVNFPYQFEEPLAIMPVIYMPGKINIMKEENLTIDLLNGTFSSSGANLTLMSNWANTNKVDFENIYLKSGSRSIFVDKDSTVIIENGENSQVTNLTFPAISNLKGEVSLNLTDGYKIFEVNKQINPSGLFADKLENQVEIQCDTNTAILERMGRMGNYYVLVSHCEDEEGNRVKVKYDASIDVIVNNSDRHTLNYSDKSVYGEIGCDTLFDLYELEGIDDVDDLKENTFSVQNITISNVCIQTDDVVSTLNLNGAKTTKASKDVKALEAGKLYLVSRGMTQVENDFYYWDDRTFHGVFKSYIDGKTTFHFLTGTSKGNTYDFTSQVLE